MPNLVSDQLWSVAAEEEGAIKQGESVKIRQIIQFSQLAFDPYYKLLFIQHTLLVQNTFQPFNLTQQYFWGEGENMNFK